MTLACTSHLSYSVKQKLSLSKLPRILDLSPRATCATCKRGPRLQRVCSGAHTAHSVVKTRGRRRCPCDRKSKVGLKYKIDAVAIEELRIHETYTRRTASQIAAARRKNALSPETCSYCGRGIRTGGCYIPNDEVGKNDLLVRKAQARDRTCQPTAERHSLLPQERAV